ncbi:MAG: amidase [Alphaproteobacteria bacterium]|nr:amidase [Alphaproteobacteria bacterium]
MSDIEANGRPLWQWSACDIAQAVARGAVSCEDATGAAIERMRATNGKINAVVEDLGDAAIETARGQDKAGAGAEQPMFGVPVTIKENIDQKGHTTPNGVAALAKTLAPGDAPVVSNFKKAGAIPIGRTNTPEFSFRATTVNELHGRTFSPWNDWASAGGSSGGAAAGVMMGYGAVAHGNDIGGSLRFPAYACGAATVKPGLGRVPAYNPSAPEERGPLAQIMSVQGVIAREVRDVRLAMETLVAYDPHDPWMVPAPFNGPELGGLPKVGFSRETYGVEMHPAVSAALDTARECLVDAGYVVEEIETPNVQSCGDIGFRALMGEVKVFFEADIRKHGSADINAIFDDYFEMFPPFEGEEQLKAMAERARFVREWTVLLHKYPLVLTPFMLIPTFKWDRDMEGQDGVREVLGAAFYSFSMNFMGLPAGNVPANYNDGLPVGVQIVGQRFREDLILDACEAVEQRVGIMAHKLWAR